MRDVLLVFGPSVLATMVAGVGWLIRSSRQALLDRIDRLDVSMARVSGDFARDLQVVQKEVHHIDRRVTKIESWRDLTSIRED